MQDKTRIVILGAGFGGLRAALSLAKRVKNKNLEQKIELILVDRNGYHTYTPTLYEAATTSMETANYLQLKEIVTFPIEKIIRSLPIRFVQKAITSLDLAKGDIHCDDMELKFDYLILAPGSEVNYFGVSGLKENSLPLKTFMDSLRIRDAITELARSKEPEPKILIGGGGSTGVELAGEIRQWLCQVEEEVGKCNASLTIVEGAPTILPGFDAGIIKAITKRLKKIGVNILSNKIISEVDSGLVHLKSGEKLPYDLLIWTGGIKAPELISKLPLKLEKRGKVEVVGQLECLPQTSDLKLYGKIYGIGDATCFYNPKTGNPIPSVARAAIVQADVVAHNVISDILGKKDHKTYQPSNYPYVIPVGGKWAVAKLGSIKIWGFWGWLLKGLVELNYLLSIMPFWKAIKLWIKGLLIFIKNDRLG